jgi:putative transposase
MGRVDHEWQDTAYVLEWFGKRGKGARSQYRDFIEKGVTMGKRPDLTGGGLVRSVGGWLNLVEMRKAKVFVKGDERILDEGDFVEHLLQTAGEAFDKRTSLMAQEWDIDKMAEQVATLLDREVSEVCSGGKYRHIVKARSLLCYWAARELGVTMPSLAKRLKISPAAVSKSVLRGERFVKENRYHFP